MWYVPSGHVGVQKPGAQQPLSMSQPGDTARGTSTSAPQTRQNTQQQHLLGDESTAGTAAGNPDSAGPSPAAPTAAVAGHTQPDSPRCSPRTITTTSQHLSHLSGAATCREGQASAGRQPPGAAMAAAAAPPTQRTQSSRRRAAAAPPEHSGPRTRQRTARQATAAQGAPDAAQQTAARAAGHAQHAHAAANAVRVQSPAAHAAGAGEHADAQAALDQVHAAQAPNERLQAHPEVGPAADADAHVHSSVAISGAAEDSPAEEDDYKDDCNGVHDYPHPECGLGAWDFANARLQCSSVLHLRPSACFCTVIGIAESLDEHIEHPKQQLSQHTHIMSCHD